MAWQTRLGRRSRDGLLAILGISGIAVAVFLLLNKPREQPLRLRMTAGQEAGTRHRIAQALKQEAARHAISIELEAMAGSEEAIEAVRSGRVDVALVQGALHMTEQSDVRQVAALHIEPLHLLVKDEIHQKLTRNLSGLRGKSVNLGERGSGTYALALEVMAFSGLRPNVDFIESTLSYADLAAQTDRSRLPDAIFSVSTLPSPIARHLVTRHAYRLTPLPFREAFVLGDLHDVAPASSGETAAASKIDRRFVYDTVIPAFAYEIEPPVPPEPVHTLATRVLLVARAETPSPTIKRLLGIVFSSPFSQVIQPPLDAKLLEAPPELPWHDGTTGYVRGNSPLIADDVIDLVEKEVSILGVLAGGVFCLSKWLSRRYRRRREQSFETYIIQVAGIERQALALSKAPTLDLPQLLQLQDELARIKAEAIQRFAEGQLDGEELMSGFLVHASDTRDFLVRLVLHQRDNIEDTARAQRRSAESLWVEAISDVDHTVSADKAEL
jgi:TRAP-type uncharacterized transport system substrate-binding protein